VVVSLLFFLSLFGCFLGFPSVCVPLSSLFSW
jgi:hypothetical protein